MCLPSSPHNLFLPSHFIFLFFPVTSHVVCCKICFCFSFTTKTECQKCQVTEASEQTLAFGVMALAVYIHLWLLSVDKFVKGTVSPLSLTWSYCKHNVLLSWQAQGERQTNWLSGCLLLETFFCQSKCLKHTAIIYSRQT